MEDFRLTGSGLSRRFFSWPGVAAFAAALAALLGWPWLTAQRSPSGFELPLAGLAVGLMGAATWCMAGARLRLSRNDAGTAAELNRKQSMFRDELEQRLRVQRKLRESEARLVAIVESAPIVLAATDREGVVVFSAGVGPNPLGKKTGEAVGWPAAELFADHAGVVEGIRGALSGVAGQAAMTQDDQSFSLSLAPYRDAAGQTAGAIIVAVDVSDQRQAEDALRRTVETLKEVDQERRALLNRLVRAQEEERRRIASDIHDDSIQSVFAVGVRLQTLRAALRDPAQIEQVDRLQQAVQDATDRLRHLLFELRPAALDEGGLQAALREYLDVMKTESGIETELETAIDSKPASETEVIAYRIAQEALTNVRKHAGAQRVACAVSSEDGGILTKVVDDGVGFQARNGSVPGHLGLVAMRERAEMAGGWLRLTSSAGTGTTVEFWIPDQREEAERAA
jgi:signal transduction histidine kinase